MREEREKISPKEGILPSFYGSKVQGGSWKGGTLPLFQEKKRGVAFLFLGDQGERHRRGVISAAKRQKRKKKGTSLSSLLNKKKGKGRTHL